MARKLINTVYVNVDATKIYISAASESELSGINQATQIELVNVQGRNFSFSPPFQANGKFLVLDNTAFAPTGYYYNVSVYMEASSFEQVEWRSKSSTTSTPYKSENEYDSSLDPSESHIRQHGRDKVILIQWEEKYVNGISTGETRNRTETIQDYGQDEIKVVGTKSDTTEWRQKSTTNSTPFVSRTEYDNSITPEQSYVRQSGINKEVLVTWEEKYVNGASTGETRNRQETIQTSGRDEIKVVGTKTSTTSPSELPDNKIDYPSVQDKVKAIEYYSDNKMFFGTLDYIQYSNEPYTFSVDIYNDSYTDVTITQINDGKTTHSINPVIIPSKQWIIKSITFTPNEGNTEGISLITSSYFKRVLVKGFQLAKGTNVDSIEINNYDNHQALTNLNITSIKTSADLNIVKDALVATATKDEVTQTLNDQLLPIKTEVNQNNAYLNVLSNKIDSKVSQRDYTLDKDNIVQRLNNADSERIQLSNKISDKVSLSELNYGIADAKHYADQKVTSNDYRLSQMETSISQNGREIRQRVSQQDFNASRKTLSQVISEISTTTKGINLSYDENGNIQSYTMDRNGIQLRGDKVDITVNKDFNVMASRVDNKVGKDEVINRLNLSPEGLDIDVNKVGIRGGDSTNYIYLSQDKIEMAGTFQRTFRGNTQKDNVFMRAQGGYLRFRNNNQNRSLYYSDFGISTYIDGDSSEASGTLQFFDYTYSPTNSVRGVTLNSAGGAVALNSERNRIVLDANATVNIESETSSVYIRPMKDNRVGTNEFRFWTKLNDSVADTDGVLSYGTITELVEKAPASYSFGSGIRFDKSPKSRYIYATDKDGNIGTGDFYARNLLGDWWAKNNNLYALVDPTEGKLRITDYNGYNKGSPNYRDLQCQHIQANTIRTNVGRDFYIGVSGNELCVTNNLFYNGGNTGYQPVRAKDFIKASSAEFKHNIKKWDYDALNVISNELQLYSYKYNDDEKETIHHGPVIGDGYDIPVEFIFESGVNTNEMLSWALRAIQQLNEKINTLEEQINE
ncbi:G5 domain-containing protein [Staphylococcus haemolyticus]|nr:G5 domain-containing protein [Staphylococcus haemolyticus]MBF2772858.1 G5 domain-containing protein [Staphylococcus haemolyticus]MBF2775526.1 G5 domain-containing protein [Staphylococcus haemolyticus]MBF2814827.1 G5 domain-containing protein [Staphylococcus haemolyticus]MBF9720088.1 G5 domain-containing protein [Staphylococcus haemolyticus]